MDRRYETTQFEGEIVGAEDELLIAEAGGTRTVFRLTIEIEGPTPNLCRLMQKRSHIVLEQPSIVAPIEKLIANIEAWGNDPDPGPKPEPVDHSIYRDCGDVIRKTMEKSFAWVDSYVDNTSIEHGGYKHYDSATPAISGPAYESTYSEEDEIAKFAAADAANPEHLEPKPEHIRFVESRITFTSHPERHSNEPGLRGFQQIEDTSLYRGVYDGDPDTKLDLDSKGAPVCEPKQETWRDRPSQL